MDEIITFALDIVRKAASIIKTSYGKTYRLQNKNVIDIKDFVTDVDRKVEMLIRDNILKKFPQHSVSGEEFGDDNKPSQYKWFIDPIDGTNNFIRHLGQFAISIGINKDEKPFAGFICDPLDDTLIWGSEGRGGYINNKKINHLSPISNIEDSCVGVNFGKTREIRKKSVRVITRLVDIVPVIRTPGSTAYAIKELLLGKYDAIIDNGNFWDWCAGLIIVKECGGEITTWEGSEVKENSNFILWSNRLLHKDLLEYLKD